VSRKQQAGKKKCRLLPIAAPKALLPTPKVAIADATGVYRPSPIAYRPSPLPVPFPVLY
jgi:hypothetical protein